EITQRRPSSPVIMQIPPMTSASWAIYLIAIQTYMQILAQGLQKQPLFPEQSKNSIADTPIAWCTEQIWECQQKCTAPPSGLWKRKMSIFMTTAYSAIIGRCMVMV